MNSQELILQRITAAVKAMEGITLIQDRQWSNTGTLRTLDSDTLQQIAAVSYDFQGRYCHFGPQSQRVAALWYGESAEGKAPFVKGSIPELVDTVVGYLTRQDVEVR